MLEKMRRRHTREWYLSRVAKIREIMPDCAISTDVIAGFCGETEQDHQDTLDLFKEVGFDFAYMFYYSERPGTKAARHFLDDVPLDVKTQRLSQIIDLQNKLSLESHKCDIGKEFEVLVDGYSKRSKDDFTGRTQQNKTCVFPAEGLSIGDYVTVRVKECSSATLICEVL